MNTFRKNILNNKLCKVNYKFLQTETKLKKQAQWLKPDGYETDISIYNPITKCKVPLILQNKNVLTWYVCGPTVYDSAHIGHAATYVNTDIIRRILSDYYNINIVMAMGITDIDDKVILKANKLKQNYKYITEYYANEFIEDMKLLNVSKPDIYCKVTDYVPQIIQFVQSIINKGNAYVLQNGCVYFDTNKHKMYGKLSTPLSHGTNPDKKSPMDFCLWKAAKENEPYWESPWGHGRPGWHIECSTIASAVFGNSIDIHSGGIDLVFPHHENEEAQSCSYHDVKQWVNYWVHCGHLFLQNEKMSKSLKNTISIREFLEKYTANQFRILCLLSHYKTGLEFSDVVITNAVSTLHKIEHFIGDCNSYIAGRWAIGIIEEAELLQHLEETRKNFNIALADDFSTQRAMQSLIKLIDTTNKMLHDPKGARNTFSTCIPAIAAVSNYISTTLSKLGISHSTAVDDCRINNLVEYVVKFRNTVRTRALEQDVKDKTLLAACDEVRSNLSSCGVIIKDVKTETVWSIKKY